MADYYPPGWSGPVGGGGWTSDGTNRYWVPDGGWSVGPGGYRSPSGQTLAPVDASGNSQGTIQGAGPPPAAEQSYPNSAGNSSAQGILNSTLSAYGLSSLAGWAWNQYLNGVPIEQIMLDIRNTPEYRQRFPGMQALAAKGHAVSEGEYIDLERQYTSLLRQAGLPAGFYDDPNDFGQLIAGEVSPTELGKRLDLYSNLVYTADPSAKAFLKEYYGIDDKGILAYAIDPTKALPILEKQFLAAQESAAAVRANFGGLTKSEAEMLANAGLDPNASRQQFTRLGLDKELYQPLPGEQAFSGIPREQLLKSLIGSADAIQSIERERSRRIGAFSGGGGYAATSKGVVGVGTPQT